MRAIHSGESTIRFYHPRTGRLGGRLQGWEDEPGRDAHAGVAELLDLIAATDTFCDTLDGYVEAIVKHSANAGMFRCWEAH